ncbi:MAG: HD-GYP domain-containing protein [Rhodocyclales bacterium]|nr:HD-GYP domain-containing protein [Rhodocyclales bacterium]
MPVDDRESQRQKEGDPTAPALAGDAAEAAHIKQIPVAALRPGMFICDFNAGWMAHPFALNHLRVRNAQQVEEIAGCGIRTVFIDTRKGADVEHAPTLAEVVTSTRHRMLDSMAREAAQRSDGKVPAQPPTAREIGRARQALGLAAERLRKAMTEVRLGKPIDIPALRESAEDISAAVIRNDDALALICRLRRCDEYTFSHSLNVSVLLARFSHHLGNTPEITRQVALGGLLHDIGKMSVDREVLNKPGKLTSDEYDHMKTHVTRGLALVEPYRLPEATLAVIREHHERRDGSGYPLSATQDDISLIGRMAAIVDVYDAISSERVYHQALPAPEAIRRIFDWQHYFDPALVNSFVRCLGIYPVGSLVRLKSERLAIVLRHNPRNLIQPRVRVVFDVRRRAYLPPLDIELASPHWAEREGIVGHEDPQRWQIDIARLADY